MGGMILSVAAPLAYGAGLLALRRPPTRAGLVLVGSIVLGGLVGAVDDWLKVRRGRNTLGLRERQKTVLLLAIAALVVVTSHGGDACHAPSLARCGPGPDLGVFGWSAWVVVVVWLTANSVNFTDGLDGLLAGSVVPPAALLSVIGFWQWRHTGLYGNRAALDVALIMVGLAAGCAGFLWWNGAPAAVFMGDTGSLAIGSGLAVAAVTLHVELLVPVFGALFVAEGLSSLGQRMWFKGTRALRKDHQPQRLFRMAPLHNHFEMLGWSEPTVLVRLWIVSGIATALAGALFYADALSHL
jgi:phospho-N-acetylmuramoyl-pentapeptide-transferase